MKTTNEKLTLANCIKEGEIYRYVTLTEAIQLCKKYNRKDRRKNDNIEYQLSDDGNRLYSITRDSGGHCGDFIIHVINI